MVIVGEKGEIRVVSDGCAVLLLLLSVGWKGGESKSSLVWYTKSYCDSRVGRRATKNICLVTS